MTNRIISNKLYRHFVALLIMLFGIRFFHVLLNFKTEFGGLFRPQPIVFQFSGIIVFCSAVLLLTAVSQTIKTLQNHLQNRVLLFLAFEYLLISLFHNKVGQRSFICEIIDGNLPFDELISLYSMDFFFAAPYYFWGLLWLAISFKFAAATDRKHWLPVIWAPVLLPLTLSTNAFPAVFAIAVALGAIVCSYSCRSNPGTPIMWLWAASQLSIILFLSHNSAIYRTSLVSTLVLLPMIWLPGLLLNRQLAGENNDGANAITWLLPAICGLTFNVLLTNIPLASNLFNLWFSVLSLHFAFWTIVPALMVLLAAMAVSRLRNSLSAASFLLMGTLLSCFYLVDGLVMFKTGLRLTFNTFDWMLGLSRFTSLAATIGSTRESWPLFLVIAGLPALYLAAFRLSGNANKVSRLTPLLITACTASLAGHFFCITPAGIFKDPMQMLIASTPVLSFEINDIPTFPQLKKAFEGCGIDRLTFSRSSNRPDKATRPRNLILIMLESTSKRYVSLFGHSELTWPQISGFKNRMEIFPFFFSCFPETSNADFSVMSGLYPPNFLLLRQKADIPSPLLVDYLKKAGYDCSMYLSGFIGDTGKAELYRSRGFDRIYDALNMPGAGREEGWTWGVKEHHVVSQVNQRVSEFARNPEKPFFIYYRMMYPHAPFHSLNGAAPVFSEEGHQRGNMVGRFKNCLLYQDGEIARLIRHLDSTPVGKTTDVIIVADHGTMLGEIGRLGHGWSLEPALTNVPMLIIRPEADGFKVNSTPGSQIDILPTALAIAGLPQPEHGFCQGLNLLDSNDSNHKRLAARNIFLSSMSQTAVVENDLYYWFADDETAEPKVFRLGWKNEAVTCTQEVNVASETLRQKKKQAASFLKLQKDLLFNMEHYLENL